MKNEKRNKIRIGLVIALVIGMLFSYTAIFQNLKLETDGRSWHVVWEGNLAEAAEADPGAGASGILEIFIINHSASPDVAYLENTSGTLEGWCTAAGLGYTNADDTQVDMAHSTAFDIVVRVRGNQTNCYRTDKFYDTDLKVEITSADLSIGADTDCTNVISHNVSSEPYLYLNTYLNNGGSGYTIAKGATAQITSIKFSAYY